MNYKVKDERDRHDTGTHFASLTDGTFFFTTSNPGELHIKVNDMPFSLDLGRCVAMGYDQPVVVPEQVDVVVVK